MASGDRFAHIDSLRAVAALLVVWTHAAEIFAGLGGVVTGAWVHEVAYRFDFGRIGVVAFFGVSGFLIPSSLKPGAPDAARNFLIRRFWRLYPAFWVSIPLAYAIIWLPFGRSPSLQDIALNFTMAPEWLGAAPAMGLYWTLQIELLFYAICLGLLATGLLRRGGVMAGCLTVSMGAFGFLMLATLLKLNTGELAILAFNLSAMFVGAVWRRFLDGKVGSWLERLILAGACAVFLILLPAFGAVMLKVAGPSEFWFRFPASYGLGMAVFLLMTSLMKVRWAPLAAVGRASYSLYLMHPLVIYAAFWLMQKAGVSDGDIGLLTLAAMAGSIALAFAAYLLVEKPAIAIGRRMTDGRTKGAGVEHAAP